MILKFLLSTFFFLHLSIVEGDGGVSESTAQTEDAGEEVTESPEDAVLSELGLDETSDPETISIQQEADGVDGSEENQEGKEAQDVKAATEEKAGDEGKKEGITDADLAPLESKNQRTNERFQKVTEGYKQEKKRAEEAVASVEKYRSSFDALKQLGFNDPAAADDLVQFAGYRNILQSGDAETFKQVIAAQVKQFEAMHGKRIAIQASALDDHQDLKERVSNFEMEEEVALELAKVRTDKAREDRARRYTEDARQQQERSNEVISNSIAQVNALEEGWKSSDPDAKALLPHLKSQMEYVARNFPAEQWPQVVQMQYKSLKAAMANASLSERQSVSRPLRSVGYTAGTLETTNPQDAVLHALGLAD